MNKQSNPWYREPWPWLLMAGPAAVIVAGAVTTWLAVSGADGLVEDDYYKQGLAVNQRKQRDAEARSRGLVATVRLATDGQAVEVEFDAPGQPRPPALTLALAHPTRAGRDLALVVPLGSDGRYRGQFPEPLGGRWYLSLDDATKAWRLSGEWGVAAGRELRLGPKDDVPAAGGQNPVAAAAQRP